MENSNAVSVIIPTHNRSGLVGRAVESALAAADPGDEVIVIDDGYTDDMGEVLWPFHDKIRYVRAENSGLGAARNLDLNQATRPLVAF